MNRPLYPLWLILLSSTAGAADPIPAPVWPEAKRQAPADVAKVIDREIDAKLADRKIAPSPRADDAEFLRRVHLDLIGRVPTPARATAFLDSKDADKRAKLIDELLADPEFGKHFANVWHDQIIPRIQLPQGTTPEALRAAFAEAFNAAVPWGEVAARVALCADGTKEKNFVAFYRVSGDTSGNAMANVATRNFTRLFLGVRMECAECHDDPNKPWKQDEFWSIAVGECKRTGDRTDCGFGYGKPVELNTALKFAAEHEFTKVEFRSGNKPLGVAQKAPWQLEGVKLTRGLHAMMRSA